MTSCPHCNNPGVTSLAKRWSSREHPAVCRLCGRLSHVINSTSSGIFVVSIFIVGIFFLIGAMNDVTLISWLGLPVAVGHNIWAWKRAVLWPITVESAKSSNRVGWFVEILTWLGIFWS